MGSTRALALAVLVASGCGGGGMQEPPAGRTPESVRTEMVLRASETVPSTDAIALGGHPGEVVATGEAVWVTVNRGRGEFEVARIDPATDRVVASVPVAGNPFELAAGEGYVWVTGRFDEGGDVLHRIDPETNRVAATLSFPGQYAEPLAVGEGAAWLLLTDREERTASLARIDSESGEVDAKLSAELGPAVSYVDEIVAAHGAVWMLALGVGSDGFEGPGRVVRIDPHVPRVEAVITADALGIGTGPGGLWVTGCVDCDDGYRDSYFAQEIDTRTNAPVGPRLILEDIGFGTLFVGAESPWFSGYAERGSHTVAFELDPETPATETYLRIGDFLHSGMAFDEQNGAIWIARAAPASLVRVKVDGGGP